MPSLKHRLRKIKLSHLMVVGVLFLILLAGCLLWFNISTSMQSYTGTPAQVRFNGEYRVSDGEWKPIKDGEHIPATQGDVTLKLDFYLLTPSGEPMDQSKQRTVPIAFYMDHINLTFYKNGVKIRPTDNEHPIIGKSACGVNWTSEKVTIGGNETFEIVVHNPHRFGNENAIDQMLSNVATWENMNFQKDILSSGDTQRYVGILFVIVAFVFLGTALFSTMIHLKSSKVIWLFGALVLFAGIYFTYTAPGVSFWNDSVVTNTTVSVCSMMFYMMFVSLIITYMLKSMKKAAVIAVSALGAVNAVLFILPIVSPIYFYNTLSCWVAAQIVTNVVLAVGVVRDFCIGSPKQKWLCAGAVLPLIAFAVDVVGTLLGAWQGGLVSQYAFILIFVVAIIMVLKLVPYNINAATKARELEMEKIVLNAQLADSRISTMISQIRPHFIYNTLGSIE